MFVGISIWDAFFLAWRLAERYRRPGSYYKLSISISPSNIRFCRGLELTIRNGHCAGANHLVASIDAESISTAPRPRFGHHGQTIVRGDPLFEANPTHLDNSH
jgi:hypothetical protein